MSNQRPTSWVLFAILLITAIIYWPGLGGGFFFDDAWNIENNSSIKISELTPKTINQVIASGESGPLKRPISMMSFALNHYFTGDDAYYFKLTNLCIHLLNGIALFFLTRLILRTYQYRTQGNVSEKAITWVCLAVTAAWLLHPLNLTSVLYIVQRMNSLTSLFVICGLIMYVRGRQQLLVGEGGKTLLIFSILLFLPLAALSKENGALLPALMLVIELSFFRFKTPETAEKKFLFAFFCTIVLAPFLLVIGYLIQHPEIITNSYTIRDFDLQERVLTETRILWMYLQMIIVPTGGIFGLFHDDIAISKSIFEPISTLFSSIGIIALAISAFLFSKRAPLITFGIMFFLVGHSMESTIIGLELAHEHRNYLPQYGILLPLFYYITFPPKKLQKLKLQIAIPIILITLFTITTLTRALHWENAVSLSLAEIKNHPNSPRANYQIGRIYAALADTKPEQYFDLAASHFIKSAQLRSNYTDGLFALLVLYSSNNKPIEKQSYEILIQRLKMEPLASNSINQISSLIRCHKLKVCLIPDTQIENILQATLSNATLAGKSRAIVLVAASNYFSNRTNGYSSAIQLLQQAIQITPENPVYLLKLANIYLATKQHEMVSRTLKSIIAVDRWGKYEKQINYLQISVTKQQITN